MDRNAFRRMKEEGLIYKKEKKTVASDILIFA